MSIRNELAPLHFVKIKGNEIGIDFRAVVMFKEEELQDPALCINRLKQASDFLADKIEQIESIISKPQIVQ